MRFTLSLNLLTAFLMSMFSLSAKEIEDSKSKILLFSFEEVDIEKQWIVVNDNVMGGRSQGGFKFKKISYFFLEVQYNWGWLFFHSHYPQ